MLRVKTVSSFIMAFAIFLSSCAPGVQDILPPDLTAEAGSDIPQQVSTLVSLALTQTALSPATSTPDPGAEITSPYPSGIKPPDSDTPVAGICGSVEGDAVTIVLGNDPSGLPLAGRCIAIDTTQRIKLVNQSREPLNTNFAGYQINLPVGGEMLLDKPVGQYLALGVHFLPMGAELLVKDAVASTTPPPIVVYSNPIVGYKLGLPADWHIDENGMTNGLNKEVVFSPPKPEPFVAYLSINLEYRTPDQIIHSYAQNVPDAAREDTIFNGYTAIKYSFPGGHSEYFVLYRNQIFSIVTDRPNDSIIQSILMTIQFTDPSYITYEATIIDNGKTFNMKAGDNIKLNLDSSYDWSTVSVSDINIIAVSQDTYQARVPGIATLTATGNPKCLSSTPPCGMPSIMFTITVIVE